MPEYKAIDKVETLRRLNVKPGWMNKELYRLLFHPDLYHQAYQKIKSKPGNMTAGTDRKTLDGFSEKTIQNLVWDMRSEKYQPKPVRVVRIPKANGKLRRLGIPSTRDKVLQEVLRNILEAIYDSPEKPVFSENSHGFRPGKSCHTALEAVQKWSAINWVIEGDITNFFDGIDHGVLIRELRKKIDDERFISLIYKILRAGYWDLEKNERGESLAGTPQGGVISPTLANVYLHAFDEYIEQIRKEYEKGAKRATSLEYKRVAKRRRTLALKGKSKTKEFKELSKRMRSIPSVDPRDENFIRIKYVRYADDWLVGVSGSKKLAEEIKEKIKNFLKEELKLELNNEKTTITHARTQEAMFLGVRVKIRDAETPKQETSTNGSKRLFKRRSTGWEVELKAPLKRIVERLAGKGFCDLNGEPKAKYAWTHLDDDQIILLFSGVNRGILNYYSFVDNFSRLSGIQHILRFSLVKTLAAKHRKSCKAIFEIYGKEITRIIEASDSKGVRKVEFYRNYNWTKSRSAFKTPSPGKRVDILRLSYRLRSRSKIGQRCCICGEPNETEMHHVRHIKKIGQKVTGFKRVMQALNRKQIPVCRQCHLDIHQGRYDGIRLKDLNRRI